jgi:hypothetical protein
MADQRGRRGRGGGGGGNRTGRGGRIPKRGEGGPAMIAGEEYVSFPLEAPVPIKIPSAVDDAAVERALAGALSRERRQAAALQALSKANGDAALGEVRTQVERHRDVLEQLARDLGADISGADAAAEVEEAPATADVATEQVRTRLAWLTLQSAAYASGDHRIDRVVKGVLREKDRHAELLTALAVREAAFSLLREPE